MNSPSSSNKQSENIRQMLHEFQARQNELEKQNEELRAAQSALRVSRDNYYDIYNFSPIPFLTLTEGGSVSEVNLAACELLGIEKKSLLQKSFFSFLESEHGPLFYQHLQKAFESGEQQTGEFAFKSSENVSRYAQVITDTFEDPVRRAKLVMIDITPRVEAQQELKKLNQNLEKRINERTAEAEAQAAKLRELAVALTTSAEAERKRLAQVLHDHLQQFIIAAKFSADQILKISKEGPHPREKTSLLAEDVKTSLTEAIEASRSLTVELYPPVLKEAGLYAALEWLARWAAKKYNLNVQLRGGGTFKRDGECNIFLFEAARECLLNAAKHSGTEQITILLEQKENHASLTVEDNGRGFDLENLQKKNGAHFGLLNLQERTRLLGGAMKIESKTGSGTRIILNVPYTFEEKKKEGAVYAPEPPSSSEARRAGQSKLRILMVDDHKLFRQRLRILLTADPGIEIVGEAKSGEEAIELTAALNPDIILMDINMPGIGGIEATHQIKTRFQSAQVIGLSLHNEEEIIQAMRDAGASAFINKGSAAEELLSAIHSFEDSSRNTAL